MFKTCVNFGLVAVLLTSVALTTAAHGAKRPSGSSLALGSVKGVVLEASDRPDPIVVPGASVYLISTADGSVVRAGRSNETGSFGFTHLSDGTYVVAAERRDTGYGEATVQIRGGRPTGCTVVLEPR